MQFNHPPLFLAMFHRQIEGDHHLLELAQRRFTSLGLGAEFYPGSILELGESLEFRPLCQPKYTIHLPRSVRLLDTKDFEKILQFAARSRVDAYGMIIHDHEELDTSLSEYEKTARKLNAALSRMVHSPLLFIEYAVGLDIEKYLTFFKRISDCEKISACIDIGHVGIRAAQLTYAETHPNEDICQLTPDYPDLLAKIDDVKKAVASGLPTVLRMIKELGKLKKPLHFHLHDGHPLSTLSPYGVCDHLSFFQEIRIPFEHDGQDVVPLLFGPSGVTKIVQAALDEMPVTQLSFSLEIHPQYDRLALEQYDFLFQTWKDKSRAEQMNSWLEMITHNFQLLKSVME